eukprot:INCI15961.1.p1 GENE.INCI15961.1~~INCI15961.1.p1  ORF type:complete len:354 (+),score=68.82 INCI15961.1:350-1411(+)
MLARVGQCALKSSLSQSRRLQQRKISIVVHGGAWAIPDPIYEASQAGVEEAAALGFAVLQGGGSAVDAVQAAVESLETNPVFDAGIGSVLNEDGDVEMDALIMDGKDLNTGSVIGINNLEHPIRLARLIMDKTHHVAFQGAGASRLADEFGLERIPQEILVTPAAVEEWKQYKKYGKAVSSLFMNDKDKQHVHTAPGNQAHHDTVGCVALDSNGNVACGTSTGGITAKKVGRVGDSPLVGSGGYAANELGGASTTGHGESIAKVLLAQRVLNTAAHSRMSIQHAAEASLDYMRTRVAGYGGVVSLDMAGNPGIAHTTERMAWAHIREVRQEGGGASEMPTIVRASGMTHERCS